MAVPVKYYIAIEGVIGVGKTTLARLMQREFDAQLLLEVFEENPFLRDFYADPQRYAFQTQIFFLLSRYQQQYRVLQRLLAQDHIISDYTFAKDRIFAHLNLQGDELDTYERLHSALAENVIVPDLVVFLQADTPVLMERIAVRDRAYERSMSVEYIERLARSYQAFFAEYTEAPVLAIDTNALNVVRNPDDLAYVIQQIRSAIQEGTHQPPLPDFHDAGEARRAALAAERRRLTDLQYWHRHDDLDGARCGAPYYGLLSLQQQVGALSGTLAQVWKMEGQLLEKYGNQPEALADAMRRSQGALQEQLADCLRGVLRLANQLDIDLEQAYLQHLRNGYRTASSPEQTEQA
ncbi:MAG: deoxynucleoside kinase [Chloroflexi bacterium]|nr:deoxynucleoside kinase [Chloroflexota bacterium]